MNSWQAFHGVTGGAVLTPAQIWELSRAWYHNRLSSTFRGRTLAEAQEIFKQFDLTSEFWQPAAPAGAPGE